MTLYNQLILALVVLMTLAGSTMASSVATYNVTVLGTFEQASLLDKMFKIDLCLDNAVEFLIKDQIYVPEDWVTAGCETKIEVKSNGAVIATPTVMGHISSSYLLTLPGGNGTYVKGDALTPYIGKEVEIVISLSSFLL